MRFSGSFYILKVVLLTAVLLSSCNNSPKNDISSGGKGNGNTLQLAPADEPGERLTLSIVITDSISGAPIPNASVYLYQADTNGKYYPEDPADESTAKLSGKIVTDSYGSFMVNTILPGEYDSPGNRHIHIHYARAAGYKQKGGIILFEDNVNDEVRKWANETGFGFIINIEKKDGTLTGTLNLKLKPDNNSAGK